MADRAADDFVSINARLKEIQAERSKKIEGTPAPANPEDVKKNTETGQGGGFTTPEGAIYDPYCYWWG